MFKILGFTNAAIFRYAAKAFDSYCFVVSKGEKLMHSLFSKTADAHNLAD
jgi:hypothetical protein